MSDWLLLALLAIGFYVYECSTWTPATAFVCFRKPFRRAWTAAVGADLIGNESGGLALADPLSLTGQLVHCAHWPVCVSAEGVCLDTADSDRFWPFDSMDSIAADERTVRINGQIAFRTVSESFAAALAIDLERIKRLRAIDRASAIREALHHSFDPDALRSTWHSFRRSSRRLSWLAALPLVWLAVMTPAAFVIFGPLASWPFVLAGLLLTGLIVSVEFIRVHRRELPRGADRWLHAVSMTLFPIAAIRAVDRISKERVSHFSPFAVVGVFCDDAAADALLCRCGFDLDGSVPQQPDSAAGRCRAWYLSEKRSAFRTLLKTLKRDPFAEPAPADPAMARYCPRCRAQFHEGTEQCADCVDVQLIRWSGPEMRRDQKPRKRKRA
jgi:hypothetical protein